MPFNPAVTDRSADYIFEGMQTQMKMNEAQKIRDQEMTQRSIGQAMESLGQLVGQFKADATKTAAVDGRSNAYIEMAKKNPDLVDPEFVAALLKEPNRGKRAEMMVTYEDFMLPVKKQRAYLDMQSNASANLAAFKGTLPQPEKSRVLATDQGLFRDTGSGEPVPITVGGKQLHPKAAAPNPMDALFGGSPQPGAVGSDPPAAPSSAFREGQKAKGPNGEVVVFKNGKWEPL